MQRRGGPCSPRSAATQGTKSECLTAPWPGRHVKRHISLALRLILQAQRLPPEAPWGALGVLPPPITSCHRLSSPQRCVLHAGLCSAPVCQVQVEVHRHLQTSAAKGGVQGGHNHERPFAEFTSVHAAERNLTSNAIRL